MPLFMTRAGGGGWKQSYQKQYHSSGMARENKSSVAMFPPTQLSIACKKDDGYLTSECMYMYVCVASFPGSSLAPTNRGPGSPLPPPFLFFVGARGEPGNEANMCVCAKVSENVSECQV